MTKKKVPKIKQSPLKSRFSCSSEMSLKFRFGSQNQRKCFCRQKKTFSTAWSLINMRAIEMRTLFSTTLWIRPSLKKMRQKRNIWSLWPILICPNNLYSLLMISLESVCGPRVETFCFVWSVSWILRLMNLRTKRDFLYVIGPLWKKFA